MNIFNILGKKLVKSCKNIKMISFIFIWLCFFLSQFITNDVALITFVPFSIEVFYLVKKEKYLTILIILETIAANIGSSLTPIGNPQNIYLYNLMNISFFDFIKIMLPYVFVCLILLIFCNMFFIKNEKIQIDLIEEKNTNINFKKLFIYIFLFAIALFVVVKIVNYYILLLLTLVLILVFDTKNIKNVDYCLLLTFIFLFIFIGNISRIEVINNFFAKIINGKEILISILASQFISNVPATILLSKFTNNYKELLIGVSFGGLGTLIASMASLISYKFYTKSKNSNQKEYIIKFSIFNFIYLIILLLLKCIFL